MGRAIVGTPACDGASVQPFDCEDPGMPGSAESAASVAAAYFDAWKSKDLELVRPLLHDDVAFDGALGSTRGIGETIAGLGRAGVVLARASPQCMTTQV